MINKDQVWSFMAMFAPKLAVLSNFGEMPQLWIWVTHFDEDCQISPTMALWSIMASIVYVWSIMIRNIKFEQ